MTRRKDGLWQEVMQFDGEPKPKYFYGKTKKEVLEKINQYKQEQKNKSAFEVVAEEWLKEHERNCEYNTLKGYKPSVDRASNYFAQVPIQNITPLMINTHILKLSRTYSEKTVKTQLSIYNMIFTYAVSAGYITYNPARDLKVPVGLPKSKRTSPLSKDIKIVKNSLNCDFGLFPFFAMYTGLRRGELLALDWSDIDLENRTVDVNKSVYFVGNTPHLKLPKTATSMAKVPILDALYSVLVKIKPQKGLLFPNYKGELLRSSQYEKKWELYCKETGVEFTPHQLRHAYATMLFEANVPPEKAQVLLRHAQLSTTMDIYTDLREEKQKEIFKEVYKVDIV